VARVAYVRGELAPENGINVRERTDQMSVKSWDDARGIGEMNVAGGLPT